MMNSKNNRNSSTEGSQSVGRSSNGGGRTGSQDRVLKLQINKSKLSTKSKQMLQNKDPNKVIASIQRIRQEGTQTQTTNMKNG